MASTSNLCPCYRHQLQDPNGSIIAFIRPTRPVTYPGFGDVYAELHYVRSAGAGVVVRLMFHCLSSSPSLIVCPVPQMHPPLMDTVTVTAMLYRFAQMYNL